MQEKKLRRISRTTRKNIVGRVLYESLKPLGEGLGRTNSNLADILETRILGYYKGFPVYNSEIWNGEWHEYGRKYTIRGIYNLVSGNAAENYNFVLDREVVEDLENFIKVGKK